MTNILEHYSSLERSLDRELSKHPAMLQLERRTGLRKTTLVFLFLLSILSLIVLRFAATPILALAAFMYPAIMSVQAVEGGDRNESGRWLSYWCIVGGWTVFESLSGGVLGQIVPLYSLAKLAALIWLMMPHSRGATLAYEYALRPLLLKVKESPAVRELVNTGKANVAGAKAAVGPNKMGNDSKASLSKMPPDVKKEAAELKKHIEEETHRPIDKKSD